MIFKNLFNPFKKLVSLIEKKEYENAMQHIFLNPDLSKQNYFMHVCAYSKNFDLINFALKYKPSFSCSDEDFNPLHFLAHLGSFLYESKSGHGLDFVTVPYEYNNLGKHRYSYRLKHKYFDPRCIKLSLIHI